MGHRVALEARRRGVIVRPLGDTMVLMPPLSISKADLYRLVSITADSIEAAHRSASEGEAATSELREAA
jgi:adenosylmethionine-8-amino-7-oxononanoate aminotransferase